jgi:glutamate/aspartate transport system permease protein
MLDLDLSFVTWELLRKFILQGFIFSVELTVVASLGGLVLGTLLAIGRLSSWGGLSGLCALYVNTMRSIPLVMVILWFYLLIPLMTGHAIGVEFSAYFTFVAFEAAYFSEIMRAGIASVSPGQKNAALALGLTPSQSLQEVILPQAFRNMLPVLFTQTIVLFQDTSLVYAIGAYDLLKGFVTAGKIYGRPEEAYLLAAVVYLALSLLAAWAVKRLESRIAIVR